jgi:hypothetical protein
MSAATGLAAAPAHDLSPGPVAAREHRHERKKPGCVEFEMSQLTVDLTA